MSKYDSTNEDRIHLYDFLRALDPGDLFILKIEVRENDEYELIDDGQNGILKAKSLEKKIKCEYSVMQRTFFRRFIYESNADKYDKKLSIEDDPYMINHLSRFFEPFFYDVNDKNYPQVFYSLDDPELIVLLDLYCIDARKLPMFCKQYDDRTMIIGDDGNFTVIF